MIPPILYINLDRSVDRDVEMRSHLGGMGLPFVRITAIDGRTLTSEQALPYDAAPRTRRGDPHLTNAEIACFLSHRRAWAWVVESGRASIILEDDARIHGNGAGLLQRLTDEKHAEGFVRLGANRTRFGFVVRELGQGKRLLRCPSGGGGAWAYCLTPAAASALLAASQTFSEQVDTFLDHQTVIGFPTYCVAPFVAQLSDIGRHSSIGPDRNEREVAARQAARPIQEIRRRVEKMARSARKAANTLTCASEAICVFYSRNGG